MKRVFSVILAIAMVFALTTVLVAAAPPSTNANYGAGVSTKTGDTFVVRIGGNGNAARIQVYENGAIVYTGRATPANNKTYTVTIVNTYAVYDVTVFIRGNSILEGSKVVDVVYSCDLVYCSEECVDCACDEYGCANDDCFFGRDAYDACACDCPCECGDCDCDECDCDCDYGPVVVFACGNSDCMPCKNKTVVNLNSCWYSPLNNKNN